MVNLCAEPSADLFKALSQYNCIVSVYFFCLITLHICLDSMTDLSLEKPIETAMLLSLSGVNCVLANQWHCTLQDNADIFNTLMKGMLKHLISYTF